MILSIYRIIEIFRSQFEPEKILTLGNLLRLLEGTNLTIFLLISDSSSKMIEKLKSTIKLHESFTRRVIVCSKSPVAIYQVGLLHYNSKAQF